MWRSTPREIWMVISGAAWRHDQAARLAVATAWQTAAFTRTKKLPRLSRVLAEPRKTRRLTPEQERLLWLDWAAEAQAAGLPVVVTTHETPVM